MIGRDMNEIKTTSCGLLEQQFHASLCLVWCKRRVGVIDELGQHEIGCDIPLVSRQALFVLLLSCRVILVGLIRQRDPRPRIDEDHGPVLVVQVLDRTFRYLGDFQVLGRTGTGRGSPPHPCRPSKTSRPERQTDRTEHPRA